MNQRVILYTDDGIVWHKEKFLISLAAAMHKNLDIVIDTNTEGPDISTLEIYPCIHELALELNYDLSKITIYTANQFESPPRISVLKYPPILYLNRAKKRSDTLRKKIFGTDLRHIGYFVSRGNWHRLKISSYLWNNHRERVLQTYHFKFGVDYHHVNIGIEDLVERDGLDCLGSVKNFLSACPLLLDPLQDQYPIVHPRGYDIVNHYSNFFVEIVSETYLQGDTFFPTEKLWRPITQLTPFIVQGPKLYLKRLRDLGFKTFGQWWDEGHDEDPYDCHAAAIEKIIDHICSMEVRDLDRMYQEMLPTLRHNLERFLEITADEIQEKLHI